MRKEPSFSHNQVSGKDIYAALPLVYACSGCSSAAQLANALAVRLDHTQLAEMSCIAGVGGNVPSLVKKAKNSKKILALDGCPLHCAKHCLNNRGIVPTVHIDLSRSGIQKRFHADATIEEDRHAWTNVVLPALAQINTQDL